MLIVVYDVNILLIVLLKFQWALHCLVNDIAVQLPFVNVCPLIILSLW